MSASDTFRYTAYSEAYPVGHGVTVRRAVEQARQRGCTSVTHIILRRRAYPFTALRRYDCR